MNKIYDVIILGAGPAGLAAGLYAGRSRLSTLIIEKGQDGGQISNTDEIENYPGQNIDGMFGLFGFIGCKPNSHLFEGILEMENGYIVTDADMHTSLPGVFAAVQAEHYISNH